MLVDESLENLSDILELHNSGVSVYGVYFLCVSEQSRHALEVIEAAQLLKTFNSQKRYKILGAASSRRQAFEFVRRLVDDFIKTGQSLDGLKEYLLGLSFADGRGGHHAAE